MKNKNASASVWILIILILIAIGIGTYFLFFHMSETKAKNIIIENYNKDVTKICNRFYVSEEKCPDFSSCYIENAANTMPKNLLVQFAKDIIKGKSSASDSYSLINGKQIGEDCVKEILEVPENVDVNILTDEPIVNRDSQSSGYLLLKDIGNFEYKRYSEQDVSHLGISRIDYNAYYHLINGDVTDDAGVNVYLFKSEEDREQYFNEHLLELYTEAPLEMTNKRTLNGIEIYGSEPGSRGDKLSAWEKGKFVIFLSEPKNHDEIFNAYFDKYS